MDTIYQQLSAYRLIGTLHQRVAVLRPSVSRNTIHLAFTQEASTPLRKMIVQLGEKLLAEHEEQILLTVTE